ncbi:DUF6493 family protein [Streptomyces sp. NPDC097619]|uniref:DUF6493 family protein n=1 Tax=Streptomyces sp. NPDC097619 TaxID=3157228 RepID=UPI00332B5E85
MNDLLEAVRAGRGDLVPALLAPLTDAERRARLPELTALRREVRGWDWSRRWDAVKTVRALLLAGAGCQTGAAAAATWIAARELRDGRAHDATTLAALLAGREPAWRADVAHRLAARTSTVAEDYPLIRALLAGTGAPMPGADGFVHAWALDAASGSPDGRRRRRERPRPLRVALREDPHTAEMVPKLFETAEPAPSLIWYDDAAAAGRWPAELARLADEGVVARSVLVSGAVSRLLRGGRARQLTFYADLLDVLDLTVEERAAHIADWIALTADAESPLAARAQRILGGLFEAGHLDAERLAEMSVAVLFRPEKKLVRAQLTLLGKALRRDREERFTLLPAVAAAFGHADTALQERALGLVFTHLGDGDEELRSALAFEAEQLGPALRRRAAEVFGAIADLDAETEGYEEVLPVPPAPRRLDDGDRSLAATAELVAALVNASVPDPMEAETACDLLVRHAHRDREALIGALRPVVEHRYWSTEGLGRRDLRYLHGVEVLAAAVLGRVAAADLVPESRSGRPGNGGGCVHDSLNRVTRARVREAALAVLAGDPPPFLLATPGWDSGALDPAELIERLAEYRRLGVGPGPVDFGQALLRVRREPGAADAAAALGTPEGTRLAAWLAGAEAAERAPRRTVVDGDPAVRYLWGEERNSARRVVVGLAERPELRKGFPGVFHALGEDFSGRAGNCRHWRGGELSALAVMPQDREEQAVWLLPGVTGCATVEERGIGPSLSRLAELGGPAGPALHLAVATGLGARHAEDRLAAVDALLVLAGRGELDTAVLGADLAELLSLGTVKPNRLADALRTAAATGAWGTTWALLAGALPAVLADGAARGAGELLAVAADCAERCGAVGPVPEGLEPAAARRGGSQLAVQARRLRTALSTGSGAGRDGAA